MINRLIEARPEELRVFLEEAAGVSRYKEPVSYTHLPSNVSAVEFYKARGYLQIGLRRGYYPAEKGGREDALVMQKRLDAAVATAPAGASA